MCWIDHPLDPPAIHVDGTGLELSHLTFQRDAPARASTALLLALRSWAAQLGASVAAVGRANEVAVAGIVASNVTRLETIRSHAFGLRQSAVADLIAGAVELQIRNLGGTGTARS